MLLAIVVTVCQLGVCREVVAARQEMPACMINQAALADWKAHSLYRGQQWSIGGMRCEPADYEPKDAI